MFPATTLDDAPVTSSTTPALPPAPTASTQPPARGRRWLRRLAIFGGAFAALLIAAALLLHFVFADALLEVILSRLETRSGLRVRFATAELSVLRGRCVLNDVRILRTSHPAGEADLSASRIEIQVGLWSLLRRELSVERLAIGELRGNYERVRSAEGRAFVLREVEVSGATLRLVDRSTAEAHVVEANIDRLSATEIHRDTLLWDVLLRSNAKGRIGQSEFEASSVRDDDGGLSTWTLPRIAASDLFARKLPAGAIVGACAVRVTHRWDGDEPTQARSAWKVGCEGLGLRPGLNAEGVLGVAARWLEEKPRPLDLDFQLDVGPDHFSGAGAALARPLLKAAGTSAVQALLANLAQQTIVGAGTRLLEKAREWRRNRANPPPAPPAATTPVGGGLVPPPSGSAPIAPAPRGGAPIVPMPMAPTAPTR